MIITKTDIFYLGQLKHTTTTQTVNVSLIIISLHNDATMLFYLGAFHKSRTHLKGGGGGGESSLLYISIAYYMQKGGGWVQIACKIAYVLNGRPLGIYFFMHMRL